MLKPKRPGDVLQINCIARMGQIAFKIMRQQPLPECECRGASGLLGKGCTEQLVRGRFHNYEGVQCLCPVPHNGMTTLPDTWGWFEYVVLSKDPLTTYEICQLFCEHKHSSRKHLFLKSLASAIPLTVQKEVLLVHVSTYY